MNYIVIVECVALVIFIIAVIFASRVKYTLPVALEPVLYGATKSVVDPRHAYSLNTKTAYRRIEFGGFPPTLGVPYRNIVLQFNQLFVSILSLRVDRIRVKRLSVDDPVLYGPFVIDPKNDGYQPITLEQVTSQFVIEFRSVSGAFFCASLRPSLDTTPNLLLSSQTDQLKIMSMPNTVISKAMFDATLPVTMSERIFKY